MNGNWTKKWRSLDPVARRLISIRFLRSIAQGALGVDFTLFLRAKGWPAAEIGLLLMAGGLSGAALSLLVGVLSDRVGRKRFLLIYEIGLSIGTALILFHPAAWLLAATAALFGFGRGANGASGPFAPAEQAWLAQSVSGERRGPVFSLNAALQFWGMGAGSLLAGALPLLFRGPGPAGYDSVFALNLATALVNLWQIYRTPEAPRPVLGAKDAPDRIPVGAESETSVVQRRENRALTLLTLVNMLNSLGVGLIAPLLPYWFSVRYGVGPEAIGSVYGLTFALTGFSSLAVGRLTERIGLTKSIVLPRLIGILALVSLPFMPTFFAASVLYVIRSMVNRGSLGARQAFSVGLVRDERRGLASSLNAVSWNVPASFGPALGGWMIGIGSLAWPFLLASALQFAYVVMFSRVMGRYEPGPAPRAARNA